MRPRTSLAPRLAAAVHEAAAHLEWAVHEDCALVEEIERLLVDVSLHQQREMTTDERDLFAGLCRREREAHLRHLLARRRYDALWSVINAELLESA